MVQNLYSKKVLQYFLHPKNMGKIKNPDGVATVGNPVCGDIARYYIKIKTKKVKGKNIEYLDDIKVETLGCGAAIATSSMATEIIKGKPLKKALELTNKAITEALGGLPPIKTHCSLLAEEGIKKAIENYQKKVKAEGFPSGESKKVKKGD